MNDYAGLLDAAARQRLESKLAAREAATGVQMVVALFPSLEGESLEDFGIRLAERWRVGDKRLDNGVILLREAMGGGGRHGYTATRQGWTSRRGSVLPPIWWGGGGWGGGGSSSGGGGGFSAGGGSFGGGGASGEW